MSSKLGKQLIAAVSNNNIIKITSLIKNGADVNYFDGESTPLLEASLNGFVKIIDLLMLNNANIEFRGNHQLSPLMVASHYGHIKVVEALLKYNPDIKAVDKDGISAVSLAAKQGHLKIVKLLHKQGADLNVASHQGATPLIYAAEEGRLDVVKYLIENDVNIDAQNNYSSTALIYATQNKHLKTVQYLTDKGANLEITTSNSVTALLIAVLMQNIEIAKYLIKAGASTDVSAKDGMTPLVAAQTLCNKEMENILLEAELNGPVINLLKAADRGDIEEAGRLLDKGVPIDASRKRDGATPLLFAVKEGHTEMVHFLVSKGADTNLIAKGIPLIGIAAQHDYNEIAEILLDNGAEIDVIYSQGMENITALRIAIEFQHEKMVATLLKYGFDPNIGLGNGKTNLIAAVIKGNTKIVKLLIEEGGADINVGDKKLGVKPIQLAAAANDIELVEYLYQLGAASDEIASKGFEIFYLGCGADAIDKHSYSYLNCTPSGCYQAEGHQIYVTHFDFDDDFMTYHTQEILLNEALTYHSVLEESINIVQKAGENYTYNM